jgi:hypothetical protein
MRNFLIAAFTTCVFSGVLVPASASPITPAATKPAVGEGTPFVEHAGWRHRRWHHRHHYRPWRWWGWRHYRHHHHRHYW